MKCRVYLVLLLWIGRLACFADVDWPQLQLTVISTNTPATTHITHADDGSGRLFIAQQAGRIRVVQGTNLAASVFLDISGRTYAQSEGGLFSMAFPSQFAAKRYFYVCYSRNTNLCISRFSLSPTNEVGDTNSEQLILAIPRGTTDHYAGQIAFGADGYLYVATGDANNPSNSQTLTNLLGKLLRIDVEHGNPYVVPADNPFVNVPQARPEIWALGLRNPWRFSFDRGTGDLFIGDVGFNGSEEIDFQPAAAGGGQNYGWPYFEGNLTNSSLAGVTPQDLTAPILERPHFGGGQCIIGGLVCRANAASARINGMYLFGDWVLGGIFGMRQMGGSWQSARLVSGVGAVSTFGEDESGEIYFATTYGQSVYRISDSGMATTPTFSPSGTANNDQITVTTLSPNSIIRYTFENRNPTEADPTVQPGQMITVTNGATVRAQTYRADLLPSIVATQTFTLVVADPIFSPSGAIPNECPVTITTATAGAEIRYTLEGEDPTTNSPLYTSPITLSGDITAKAKAFKIGFNSSSTTTANFTWAVASTPVIGSANASGNTALLLVTNGTPIVITSATPNVAIYYTVDGSLPTTNSDLYTGPFPINGNSTISAIAVHPQYQDSPVATVFLPLLLQEKTIVRTFVGNVTGFADGFRLSASLNRPSCLWADSNDVIYFTDALNYRVRKILPTGDVITVAGTGNMGTNDGVGTNARFSQFLRGICGDTNGNVYVVDYNNVRKISPSGEVTTFCSLFDGTYGDSSGKVQLSHIVFNSGYLYGTAWPYGVKIAMDGSTTNLNGGWRSGGLCFNSSNELFFTVQFSGVSMVYKQSPLNPLTSHPRSPFADGPTQDAGYSYLINCTALPDDSLLVTEQTRVRRIGTNGIVTTVAGALRDDVGPFGSIDGACVDSHGNIYVADANKNRIFIISADVDSDGIPDCDELPGTGYTVGINDRTVDSDSDGRSNADEYTAGTDPLSASSHFKIASAEQIGGTISLTWNSVRDRSYQVWTSTNLSSWSLTLTTNTTGGVAVVSLPISTKRVHTFYRLTASLP